MNRGKQRITHERRSTASARSFVSLICSACGNDFAKPIIFPIGDNLSPIIFPIGDILTIASTELTAISAVMPIKYATIKITMPSANEVGAVSLIDVWKKIRRNAIPGVMRAMRSKENTSSLSTLSKFISRRIVGIHHFLLNIKVFWYG